MPAVVQPSGMGVRIQVPHASWWDDRDEQSIRTICTQESGPPCFLFPFFQPHERSRKQSELGRRDRLEPHDWPTTSSAFSSQSGAEQVADAASQSRARSWGWELNLELTPSLLSTTSKERKWPKMSLSPASNISESLLVASNFHTGFLQCTRGDR